MRFQRSDDGGSAQQDTGYIAGADSWRVTGHGETSAGDGSIESWGRIQI